MQIAPFGGPGAAPTQNADKCTELNGFHHLILRMVVLVQFGISETARP